MRVLNLLPIMLCSTLELLAPAICTTSRDTRIWTGAYLGASDANLEVEKFIDKDEHIVITLPCVGFSGFPDFGEDNDQERVVRQPPP